MFRFCSRKSEGERIPHGKQGRARKMDISQRTGEKGHTHAYDKWQLGEVRTYCSDSCFHHFPLLTQNTTHDLKQTIIR